MGMYSRVTDSEITWRGKDSKKSFRKWATAKDPPKYVKEWSEDTRAGYEHWRKELAQAWKDDDCLNGEPFSDIKLIGYWYQGLSAIFRDIAQWVDGYIRWEYETGDQFLIMKFAEGKAVVSLGEVKFDEPEEIEEFCREFSRLPPIPDKERILRQV